MKLNKNMSDADRIIRTLIAIVFAVLYFTGIVGGTLGLILLIVGIVFVFTAIVSWCPIYQVFKISTRKS